LNNPVFVILIGIQRDTVINLRRFSYKLPVILVKLNEILSLSTQIRKTLNYNICPVVPFGWTDGQTWRS